MPQPESCSSDWRISGFSASSSSCLIETGSEATQPNTRHMATGCYRGDEGANFGRSAASPTMAIKVREPSRIWWARPGKLCGMERPGGGGRSHRPERRAAEIAYLKEHGVRLVVSTMSSRHNLGAYEAAGLPWHHVPVESAQRGADALEELLPLLRRELRRRGAVAVHGDRHTDFVAAVCAAHLHEARGVEPAQAAVRAAEAGLMVNGYTCALLGVELADVDSLMRSSDSGERR